MSISETEFQAELAASNTFEDAAELLYMSPFKTPDDQRRWRSVFDKALELVTSRQDAQDLYETSVNGNEVAARCFAKMIEMSKDEDDLMSVVDYFDAENLLRRREQVVQIFKRADELGIPKD